MIGDWGGGAGLDMVAKKKSHHFPFQELNPCLLAHNLVPILTELTLPRLCTPYTILLVEEVF
jgi:hypothetical protein